MFLTSFLQLIKKDILQNKNAHTIRLSLFISESIKKVNTLPKNYLPLASIFKLKNYIITETIIDLHLHDL